jgi:hypothetical protein
LYKNRADGFETKKGYNEFVLYGEEFKSEGLEISTIPVYNFFTAMSWDNGAGELIKEPGSGRGLFFRN